MKTYNRLQSELQNNPKRWLITGVAGFIGSNLLEALLKLNQKVIGLDNFLTGHQSNLDDVQSIVSNEEWKNFTFLHGDICNLETCIKATKNIDYVLHQAAMGSVPRSIENPIQTNNININGFLNMLYASKKGNVSSFTYAASSSTYGDHHSLPKVEDIIGKPLSPYAITKYVNELYASVFSLNYGFHSVGLRYFNVFGKRQDPDGAYAAVIPKWIAAMLSGEDIFINGDGSTSRDFCFIDNAVQANILAATSSDHEKNNVYNIAVGDRTSLNELYMILKNAINSNDIQYSKDVIYREFRSGDVLHSQADITKAITKLQFNPSHDVTEGINQTVNWYIQKYK